ncbi:MAG TPA: hypothetical protein PLN06_01505 [Bacteroidales bacterium]|nr:hypothetical protein [Bacteroidales bacterium]HOU95288.1 hypothetical protein [Bacteroidales bacterium]HQG35624.1 hypothetical protein [Bacteroidales bacterium]HQG51934.1 hypothetical protein [Bacteroidales bacterium]HQJ19630.1 hypothetical protein [Bacteroidales bacterium]
MSIRIKQITAEDCGPVKRFSHEFGDLNLIYSRNEGGKSFLTEFIIHCLFRNKNPWGYLRETGKGKVTITGLSDKPVDFKPDKGTKLEDYLEKDNRGLPPSLVNLLVIKEGETEIVKIEDGIDKSIIKDLLSYRKVLDAIDNKIPQVIKQANLEQEIKIERKGKGKDYYQLKEELNKINDSIKKLNNESGHWSIKDLKLKAEKLKQDKELLLKARKFKAYKLSEEIKRIQENIEKIPDSSLEKLGELISGYEKYKNNLESLNKEYKKITEETAVLPDIEAKQYLLIKAKRHKAYIIDEKLKLLNEKLRTLPEEEINKADQNISRYHDKKNELNNRNKSAIELKEKSKDYNWLKSAKENYSRFLSTAETYKKPPVFIVILIALLLGGGLVGILLDQKIAGISLILASTAVTIFYFLKLRKSFTAYKHEEEIEEIGKEFRNRFGEELKSLTQLESKLIEQEKYHNQLDLLTSDLKRLETELESCVQAIGDGFKRLKADGDEEQNWSEIISQLRQKRNRILEEQQQLKEKLAGLEVDESEYEKEDPGIEFDKNLLEETKSELRRLKELQNKASGIKSEITNIQNEMSGLTNEIIQSFKNITDEEISENEWQHKLHELTDRRNELKEKAEHLKGELKGLGVSESEYITDDPGIEFSQEELDSLDIQLQSTADDIAREEEKLRGLQTELISITRADASTSWNDLIDLLYRKKEETEQEIENLEAEIVAGILLHNTIMELQQEEDVKLIESLNSEDMRNILYNVTGRYNQLAFEDSRVKISDEFRDFYIRDLSTGAREQVMIALRIGFLKRLFRQDSAFLILDDAFQHSDYIKRELLVNTVCELSAKGWQIIYFTMDDNIRSLFQKKQNVNYIEIDLQ